uniref:Chromo shadow domain-containing protein n=1 Tax=Schizaphis graminum TaxID=13262 RepID=A0A2S2NWA9_SCHGA
MPEYNIPFESEEGLGKLPFPTVDEIDEMLRRPTEIRRWDLDSGDDSFELWSDEDYSDNDSIRNSSLNSSVDMLGEESSEQSDMDIDPTPIEIRQANSAHNRGRNVARRGRNRGRHIGNENRNATPFERGVTFNGFARNMEPEEVVGYTIDTSGTMLYQVKWRNDESRIRLIESSVMRRYRPLMIVDFYESMMLNNIQQN